MATAKPGLSPAEKMRVRRAEIKSEGAQAMLEYQQGARETREKTERLRALRLKREQAGRKTGARRKTATRK